MMKAKGFTLLEVVIALAIFSIGIMGLIYLFPIGLKASRRAGNFTTATLLAQMEIENIKKAGYGVYHTDTGGYKRYPSSGEYKSSDYPGFRWVCVVMDKNYDTDLLVGAEFLYRVDMGIYWKEGENDRWDTFITYIANY